MAGCDQGCFRRCNTPQIWMVLPRPGPPRREANHEGRLRAGVLRRPGPPRREVNHEGRLRSGVPLGDVTHPRYGWFSAGPDPLRKRRITRAGCDQGFRAEM